MTGKYYTIQISYSTQDPEEKDFNQFENQSRLPGHPQTFFNELPRQRTSRSCHLCNNFNCKKGETKDSVAICESSPRKGAIMNLRIWSITTLNLDKEVSYLS